MTGNFTPGPSQGRGDTPADFSSQKRTPTTTYEYMQVHQNRDANIEAMQMHYNNWMSNQDIGAHPSSTLASHSNKKETSNLKMNPRNSQGYKNYVSPALGMHKG